MNSIRIGNLEWATEDLKLTVTRDGKELTLIETELDWKEAFEKNIPCYMKSKHPGGGLLYNIQATSNITPDGWQIPSSSDWKSIAKDPNVNQLNKLLGFNERRFYAFCNTEDEYYGSYWACTSCSEEMWATSLDKLSVQYYESPTKWGEECDYGLFIRCVKNIL